MLARLLSVWIEFCVVPESLRSNYLNLLLLFRTEIGFSHGGSRLTPVQTPKNNNTYINGTAQITVRVLAVQPHNTMCLH
jgi:hypothetical protein